MGAKMLPAVGLTEDRRATEKTGRKSADDGKFARELGNAVACGNNVSPQEETAGETSSVEGNTADSGGEKESGNGRSGGQAGNTSDFSGLLLVMAALAAGQPGTVQPAAAGENSAAETVMPAVATGLQSAVLAATTGGKESPEAGSTALPGSVPDAREPQSAAPQPSAAAETDESSSAEPMPASKGSAPAEATAALKGSTPVEVMAAAPAPADAFALSPAPAGGSRTVDAPANHPVSAMGGAHGAPPSEKSASPARAASSGFAGANQKNGTADPAVSREQPATERKTAPPAGFPGGQTQTGQWPAAAIRSPVGAGVGQVSREGVSEQTGHVARQIASALQGDPEAGRSQLRVHLSPADLGGINLRLLTENGRVTLQITADSSHTGALLSSHLDELNRSLAQSGVTMDRTEVFCQTGGGEPGASGGWPGGALPGFGGAGGGSGSGGSHRGGESGATAAVPAAFPAEETEDSLPRAAPGSMSFFA